MNKFMEILYSVLFFIVSVAIAFYIICKIIKAPLLGLIWLVAVGLIWGFMHESNDGM